VTQNGDWPARSDSAEFKLFGCDGLVCINPDYYRSNKDRYESALIPNGVDLGRFKPGLSAAAAFDLPTGVPIVLMVSALIESKLVGTGIEAVSRLPGVHLAVAGDGPLRASLRAKADELMPGRFHNFTVTADRMPDLYRSADAFLHLSRDESFGNVFVEAMACGLPTVAWDLERTRWITGETALLVPDRDTAALVEAIRTALDAPMSPDVITSRATRFSWSSIALQYREFLDKVVEKGT
jgi:glycosyltransferase involved in cell wall biosynthesis